MMHIGLHREFTYEPPGERIFKIGSHLPKLYQTSRGLVFFGTRYSNVPEFIELENWPPSCPDLNSADYLVRTAL